MVGVYGKLKCRCGWEYVGWELTHGILEFDNFDRIPDTKTLYKFARNRKCKECKSFPIMSIKKNSVLFVDVEPAN